MAVVVWAVLVVIIVAQVLSSRELAVVVTKDQVLLPSVQGGPSFSWPRLPWCGGLLATAALTLWIAMGEISRLAGDVPDAAGRSWELNALTGPSTLSDRGTAGWDFLLGQGHNDTIATLLCIYLSLDFLFIAVYGAILWKAHRSSLWKDRPERHLVRVGSCLVVGFDLAENVVAAVQNAMAPVGSNLSPLRWSTPSVLPFLSFFKWLAVALLLMGLLLPLLRPGSLARAALKEARHGLWIQRFSLVAVLPLAVLGLFPGPDLLDQLPDVQRRWVDESAGSRYAFVTAVTIVILFFVLFVIGRLRSDSAYRLHACDARVRSAGAKSKGASAECTSQQDDEPGNHQGKAENWPYQEAEADLRVWLVGPAVIGVLALVVGFAGGPVSKARVWIFCIAFAGVAGLSWVLRKASTSDDPNPPAWKSRLGAALQPLDPRNTERDKLPAVVKAGDILACAVFVVGGIGLVRSFTAPVALAFSSTRENPAAGQPAAGYALLFAGAVAALGVWLPAALLSARLSLADPHHSSVVKPSKVRGFAAFAGMALPGYGDGKGRMLRWGFLLGSLLAFLAIGLWPVRLADTAGVIAIVMGSLAALSTAIGSLVVFVQNQPPPELLRLLRVFRVTPVVTILLVVILAASTSGDDADVHGVQGRGSAAGSVQRPTLDQAFTTWQAQPKCTHAASVAGQPVRLRPLLLIGAEGGGIRAAYWTAAAIERISRPDNWQGPGESVPGCSAHAPFLSSGASGGAVGLTVARFSDQPVSQVSTMARPDALGAAVDGLLVRDLLFSATGLPLPVLGSKDLFPGDRRNALARWEDRAGLIELLWQEQSSSLREQFLGSTPASDGLVGELALNSTAAGTGCRMLVSTLQLDQRTPGLKPGATNQDLTAQAPAAATCDTVEDPAPFSSDTLALYGPAAVGPAAVRPAAVQADSAQSSRNVANTDTGCVKRMSAATAAMLASRFPYVTPSGVIGSCRQTPQQQLIDGGYTENYGLGTLADLSNQWLGEISEKNADALRTLGHPGAVPEIIVPVVVYMDNGTGSDLSTPTANNTNELLIPQQGKKAGGIAQADSPAELQRLDTLVGVHETETTAGQQKSTALWCPASQELCNEVTRVAGAWAPRPVIVVHQRTAPAVTAPLGWVLSEPSILTMDRALNVQQDNSCRPESATSAASKAANPLLNDAVCKRGYGSLFDLISLLRSP